MSKIFNETQANLLISLNSSKFFTDVAEHILNNKLNYEESYNYIMRGVDELNAHAELYKIKLELKLQ